MPLVNFNTTPQKGSTTILSLNKQELLQLTQVSSDEFWSTAANISRVTLSYESTIGKQQKNIDFDFTQSLPTSTIVFSPNARSIFSLKKIILRDFDEGRFSVKRSELSTSVLTELDITL